jgi:hypothetical protein
MHSRACTLAVTDGWNVDALLRAEPASARAWTEEATLVSAAERAPECRLDASTKNWGRGRHGNNLWLLCSGRSLGLRRSVRACALTMTNGRDVDALLGAEAAAAVAGAERPALIAFKRGRERR